MEYIVDIIMDVSVILFLVWVVKLEVLKLCFCRFRKVVIWEMSCVMKKVLMRYEGLDLDSFGKDFIDICVMDFVFCK